jgi:hypothetical protein
MEREVEYLRARARAECEAALNAACDQARRAHAQMAKAYALLVELHELRKRGSLPRDKVTAMADRLHAREDAEYGGRHAAPAAAPGILLKL